MMHVDTTICIQNLNEYRLDNRCPEIIHKLEILEGIKIRNTVSYCRKTMKELNTVRR